MRSIFEGCSDCTPSFELQPDRLRGYNREGNLAPLAFKQKSSKYVKGFIKMPLISLRK